MTKSSLRSGQPQLPRGAEERAKVLEQRTRFRWRIEAVHGDGLYALRNTGWQDVVDVRISSDLNVSMQKDVESVDLAAGQAVAFVGMVIRAANVGSMGLDVTVTWRVAGEDDEHSWTEPLPSRPPAVGPALMPFMTGP